MDELNVPKAIKVQFEDWYKIGMNRQRQKAHGDEVPTVRYPDLIITGAKKCGTTGAQDFHELPHLVPRHAGRTPLLQSTNKLGKGIPVVPRRNASDFQRRNLL